MHAWLSQSITRPLSVLLCNRSLLLLTNVLISLLYTMMSFPGVCVCVCVSGVLWFEKESTFINIYLYFKELWLKVIEVDHIFALENMELLTGRLRRQTPGLGSSVHEVAF